MKHAYAIKCEEHSLLNGVNDEFLKMNKTLKDENKELKNQIGNLQDEVAEVKVQQLRTSKPFVDLTYDDDSDIDSDIEIVEENGPRDDKKTKPSWSSSWAEIIDLDEEALARENSQTVEEKSSCQPSIAKKEETFVKNSAANMDESSLNDLQSFENFILEQI